MLFSKKCPTKAQLQRKRQRQLQWCHKFNHHLWVQVSRPLPHRQVDQRWTSFSRVCSKELPTCKNAQWRWDLLNAVVNNSIIVMIGQVLSHLTCSKAILMWQDRWTGTHLHSTRRPKSWASLHRQCLSSTNSSSSNKDTTNAKSLKPITT